MNSPRCGWLFATLLLAGCAGGPRPYPTDLGERLAAYARTEACCAGPESFSFTQLPAAGSVAATLGPASPVFEFHSGLSPFVAFRLPETAGPYRLRIKSLFDDRPAPAGSLFYPVVAMLDEAFIVTRVSSVENLRLEPSLATPGGEAGYALVAPFDPSQSRERYIVVFTPAVLLGAPPAERRDGDVVTGPTIDWLRRNQPGVVDPSPFGRLEILVAPQELPGSG